MAKAAVLEGIRKTEQYLTNLFKARFSFVYIPTWEEIRVIELITKIANNTKVIKSKRDVFVWSSTEGLNKILSKGQERVSINNAENPSEALNYIDSYNKPAIMILKDVHPLLGIQGRNADYGFIRKIRDVAGSLKNADFSKNVVILAPTLVLPNDLQKDITVVDFDLPTLDELKSLLDEMLDMNESSGILIDLDEKDKELLCKAAQGLTLQEAENAFARAIVERKQLTINELDVIMDEKCQVIKKTGILEFIKTDLSMNDVGGLQNLKHWLIKRNNSWLDKAQNDYNLPAPKGVLITGVPGCGKSLTAKAMSSLWKLPLLRLDAGKIFDKWVGGSEENIRKVIKTAEAVAPSILWIDEIEKGFDTDSGSSIGKRVFGTFLTWMQEKTKPVFVVATANNISMLPPEFMRKGRFDEIFFVDIPTTKEREVIFRLHLNKMLKGSISESFSITDMLINELVEKTEGFVGAEIEQAIISAVFDAFSEDRKLHKEDLFKAIENTVPLSVTQSEQIENIRKWANVRAVAATSKNDRLNIPDEQDSKLSRGGRNIDF